VCQCASVRRERNRRARPSVSSRDLKKRSRDFSDSQKSNFGVRSSSHNTASSLQKRSILKDFFLSLSRRRRQDRIRASRASSFSPRDDDEKFLARKKTKERSERRHMRDLEDIKKERKRYTSIDVAVFSTFKAPYRSGHSSSSSAVLLFCSTIMFYKLLLLFCCS